MRAPSLFALLLSVLLPALTSLTAYAQKDNTGTEFYVAFGENQGAGEGDNLMQLYITSKTNTSGTVTVPAIGFSQKFTSIPGQITTIALPAGDPASGDQTVELSRFNGMEERVVPGMAVHITSNDNITVYGINHKEYSTDAFLAFPVNVVGTEYLTINYPSNSASYGPAQPVNQFNEDSGPVAGEFWIVGISDSTNVTITPKAKTNAGVAPGANIKILLNAGDVYLVEGVAGSPTNDLTGSQIESDEPVAVFSGHVRATIPENATSPSFGDPNSSGSRNHLVEQLPPVSSWGDSVYMVRFASTDLPDLVRVVASEDNDTIKVNGVQKAVLKKGGFYEITQLLTPVSIQGSSPILVGQYMHTCAKNAFDPPPLANGDPALAIAYPVEQFVSSYTFVSVVNSAFNNNYVNIMTDISAISNISLDGTLLPKTNFTQIPGSNYYYAQLSLKQGTHTLDGGAAKSLFGISVYGLGPADGYAYVGGTGLKTITPFKTVGLVIDFGDRLLQKPTGGNNYADTFDSVVAIQNISSDPIVIDGFDMRSGDQGDFTVTNPPSTSFPITLPAGGSINVTITFEPMNPYIRRHTQLLSQTEHLHAYVVDLYGRGILDNTQIYSDSSTSSSIDTLDFGVFQNSDPAKDSFVYIANKGETSVNIDNGVISGVNAADFSLVSLDTNNVPITIPFTLPLGQAPVHTTVRFTPNAAMTNGLYQALLDISPSTGTHRDVVLLAHIFTINPESEKTASFAPMLLCTEQDQSDTISNPNDFPVTITSASIGGQDSEQFSIVSNLPIIIPPHSSGVIVIGCSPSIPGSFVASVTINFDLPKNFSISHPLSVTTSQLTSSFWAPDNYHVVPEQVFLYPIYAESPMELFQSPSMKLVVSYDPTRLEDVDFDQDQTHTSNYGVTEIGDTAGYKEFDIYTFDNTVISGGMPNDTIPIIYIKFHSHLADGDDPFSTFERIPITYQITFDKAPFPSACVLQSAPTGVIFLDSTCSTVGLQVNQYSPQNADIAFINPNPITEASTTLTFYVPNQAQTDLDVTDVNGTVVASLVSGELKSGAYESRWDVHSLPSGAYLIRLRTSGQMISKTALVLH